MNDPFDPQFEQWKLSFASLYHRPPTKAEIAEYRLTHPVRSLEVSPP